MSKSIQEIYCGWLTKSPPTKRIWRGRWRRRWFVLHQGELPAQFALSYFTDRNNHKLKGIIDLDQVEEINLGLKFEDKKLKFDYIFAIKTPTRTYYLAADTENEMKSWVKNICNICKMRPTSEEDDMDSQKDSQMVEGCVDSPPVSPVSTSPYIAISECITGKTPFLPNQSVNEYNIATQQVQSFYYNTSNSYEQQSPTYLNCSTFAAFNNSGGNGKLNDLDRKDVNASPLQSPTDSEVFTDDDWAHSMNICETGSRNIRPSNSSAEVESKKSFMAPPRPPKPQHINTPQNCYLNLQVNNGKGRHSKSNSTCDDSSTTSMTLLTDDTYDIPRSHVENNTDVQSMLGKRHCYNNAAPTYIDDNNVFTYDHLVSPKPGTSQAQASFDEPVDEPASPLSQTSSNAQYSNQPSPLLPGDMQLMPPPKVNRGLKPKRKLSDSLSITSSTEPNSPRLAPCVDRTKKPFTTLMLPKTFDGDDENIRKHRAAPSPTPFGRSFQNLCEDDSEQTYFVSLNDQRKKLEYLDLDLDTKGNKTGASGNGRQRMRSSTEDTSARSPGAITMYKKVDFIKTEAFNITRNNLEKERNKEQVVVPFKK